MRLCLNKPSPGGERPILYTGNTMPSARTLKAIRLTHNFSGVFLAPAILFFAITGGLQMFGLHETSRGSSYVPPSILVHLSQLHKKGTLFLPQRKPQPASETTKPDHPKSDAAESRSPAPNPAPSQAPSQAPNPTPRPAPPANPHNPLPIKMFFAITALGLVISTCTGVVMAWTYARRKSVVVATFLAGILIPLLLLLI
jgi:hypothetical protein